MAKKRKSDVSRMEEVDRTMYSSFCSAANSLSQLYSQAMQHQQLSFQAGERHALEKLYDCILRSHEAGTRVTTSDIVSYLQKELDYGADEPPISPRPPIQQQQPQAGVHLTNTGTPLPSDLFGPSAAGQGLSSVQSSHHVKNSVFSNALSSPVRRSLQQYHST